MAELYRQYGGRFALEQVDPIRGVRAGRDYTLASMLATRSLFVHVPKTAGVSVLQALYGNYGMGHMSIREYEEVLRPSYLYNAFCFTVVRNPWDRLHSAYHFLKKGGWPGTRDAEYAEMLRNCRSFEHFVLDYLGREDIRKVDHFRPATDFLTDSSGALFPFDYVARFCRLDDDFRHLAGLFGVHPVLPRLNSTMSGGPRVLPYLRAYTRPMVETVARHYADMIAAFGFHFDGHSGSMPGMERAWRINSLKQQAHPSRRLQMAMPAVLAAD
jgi:hypothetical protein